MPTSRPAQTFDKLADILTCYSDIEELKDEMEEWRDNMPESLQSSDKYSQVDEAANTLEGAASTLEEGCDQIKLILEKIPVSKDEGEMSILEMAIHYTEHKMYKGYNTPRWVRLANPCAALEAAMQFIESHMESLEKDLPEEQARELDYHKKQVDEALSDLQNVEFPSMFG